MRLCALLAVAVALPARAAPPPSTPAPPPAAASAPSTTTSGDPAREHYERGLAKYNLADFDTAIKEFKASYELSKAPRLLFNIAQAYRLKKDYESALYFYQTYLRAEPNPPNRDDVDAKIDEMKQSIEAARKAREAKAHEAPPPKQIVVVREVPPPPVDHRPSKHALKVGGLVTLGIGAALLAGGAVFQGLASSDAATLKRVVQNGMPWTAADTSIYNAGERSQLASIVLFSVGGAAVVAGGITLIAAAKRR